MGKKPQHSAHSAPKSYKPFVSVCTPTFNRRPFIPYMLDCFRNQTYPKSRMEWIIVDDGNDPIGDLLEKANIPQIKYFRLDKKVSLGEKRNYMHKQSKGSIIVYMDDDDYYPPERVEHAVETLMKNKDALCAGSSEMYLYFKHIQQMYQCGPYGPNHATAATFAFKSRLLDDTQYDDTAALAEEKAFLKNYTIPFVQLDPLKTILVFSHNQNSYDKKNLLKTPANEYFKPSDKPIELFIKNENEKHIKKFFTEDIDDVLAKYEPGEIKYKPDVVEQTKKIEAERQKMAEEMARQQGGGSGNNQYPPNSILLEQPGREPIVLSPEEIVNIIKQLQAENMDLKGRLKDAEDTLARMSKSNGNQPYVPPSLMGETLAPGFIQNTRIDKTTPEIKIDL